MIQERIPLLDRADELGAYIWLLLFLGLLVLLLALTFLRLRRWWYGGKMLRLQRKFRRE